MTALFKKLNYKGHPEILVVAAPDTFTAELVAMHEVTEVVTRPEEVTKISFVLAFATTRAEVDELVRRIIPKLEGDAVCWFCYPKKSSKRYESDITRDNGWATLGELGMEPVRQVAIDADWSALRFRDVRYIKQLTRSHDRALSQEAKDRTNKE